MISRRKLLGSAAAFSVAGSLGGMMLPAVADDDISHWVYHVAIYDSRFPTAAQFAEQARQSSVAVAAISGDVTDIWYHQLYHHWQSRRTPIAGLVALPSLFCLRLLARDQGMRMVYRQDIAADPALAQPALALFVIAEPSMVSQSTGGII